LKKLQEYIERNESVISGKAVEFLHQFKNLPIFFGCVDHSSDLDLVADMTWGIDQDTGAIQLTKLVPLEILYQEQHVDGTGSTWENYYKDFALYVYKNTPKRVLEIGGGSGHLANRVIELDSSLEWIVVEPNPRINESKQLKVIRRFFDSTIKLDSEVDTVVFSQVMEHAYSPKEFISNIVKFLPTGGKVIFAYPQLTSWLDKNYTNAINFEHSVLIDDFIEYLFAEHGFEIINREIYKDHSTFYVFSKKKGPVSIPSIPNKYKEYKNLYIKFIDYHEELVVDLNHKIITSDYPTYLFGAHIFAIYLFAFGLNKSIDGILDNSKLKQGRRLYGTNFIVSSPQILKNLGKVNVILKAGIYDEEIKRDILENINSEVIFW
jgi:2-polyprenyl-3-methyl-5-hydroxy-6-metoxy-1,4-benzoquinol methylase